MTYAKEKGAMPCAASSSDKRSDYSANASWSLRVPVACNGKRLDQVLASLLPEHSRSRLQAWIRDGRIRLDTQVVVEPRHKLWGGEAVEVAAPLDDPGEAPAAEPIALHIAYEDESLLVIDKPPGLVVHPGNGNWHGTLLNGLLHHAPGLAALPRAGIVHRLDKDTSGLLVVAKTLTAQTDLVRQLQARIVGRHYFALVRGELDLPGTIEAPIGRHPTVRTRMAVVAAGKPARTHYRVLERFGSCTLLECALETGRTHQIRVHLSSIGRPLVGDQTYAGGNRVARGPQFSRQALHAHRLALRHPSTGESLQWQSPMPGDLRALLTTLRALAPASWPANGGSTALASPWPERRQVPACALRDLVEDDEQGEQ